MTPRLVFGPGHEPCPDCSNDDDNEQTCACGCIRAYSQWRWRIVTSDEFDVYFTTEPDEATPDEDLWELDEDEFYSA
jgi:hypothetical protein